MIPLPLSPKIVKEKGNTAVFEIGALYPGYGLTIGNSLRRVLLSSLEGTAVTQVKIKGVSHEFSTIEGVLEDVILILLNLKKLRFKMFTKEPQTATLNIKGEKVVKAKDFKLSPHLELANPETHIATLTKPSAELNMEIQVERGVGYVPVEEREQRKAEVGVIPLDAAFTPIKKVSFRVENMRVGKRTDFDKLLIEVETDGTTSPAEAMKDACEILCNHFSLFQKEFEKMAEGKQERKRKEDKTPEKETREETSDEARKIKVEDLKISERTKNALLNNNIKTVGGLVRKSEKDLLALAGLGETAIKEIKKALKKLNLELKEEN